VPSSSRRSSRHDISAMTTAYQKSVDAYAERIFNATELANYWRLVKQQETPMKRSKLEKTAKRSLSKSVKQIYALRKSDTALAAVEKGTLTRIAQLERLAKSQSGQDAAGWGTAFELHRLRSSLGHLALAKAGQPTFDDFNNVDAYMADPNAPARAELASSRASTARAISSAQGDPINQHLGRKTPLDVMNDVLRGTGEAETLRDFEAQTRTLQKALAAAKTPQEREYLGYQVTRRNLIAMHIRGEG
jgi:hypothetical protein